MKLENLLFYVPYSPRVRRKYDGYEFWLDIQNAYVMHREGLSIYELQLKSLKSIPEEGIFGLTFKSDGFYINGKFRSHSISMIPMFHFMRLIENHYDVFRLND